MVTARHKLRNLFLRVRFRILLDVLVANIRPELARSAFDKSATAAVLLLLFFADDVVQRDARGSDFCQRVGVGRALVGCESVRDVAGAVGAGEEADFGCLAGAVERLGGESALPGAWGLLIALLAG